ncbi:hypothetical protein AX17_001688 [Amanita inopinata Kibby_2008]|nr:hypothetical protein AX17_001688 [Amanita inopinata Kibby_2008]
MSTNSYPPGTAPIKPEYLISFDAPHPAPDDDTAEDTTNHSQKYVRDNVEDVNVVGKARKKLTKEQRKAQRGANKGRKFGKVRDELDLCWKVASGSTCEFGSECRFTHDIPAYLAAKAPDIHLRGVNEISDEAPFVIDGTFEGAVHPHFPSIHLGIKCPVFEERGECRFGLKCRFLGGHVLVDENNDVTSAVDEEKKADSAVTAEEVNFVNGETLKMLRSKKYQTPVASAYLQELQKKDEYGKPEVRVTENNSVIVAEPEQDLAPEAPEVNKGSTQEIGETNPHFTGDAVMHDREDGQDAPMRFYEKKRLHWAGKTYLAPLTTVGNLPFRRLCVDYGADITCGEMGLANSFLSGSKEEWSLVRRHPSESIFGVQVAGNRPGNLVPTAEVIAKECGANVDFVDVNCGCPIDLVFKTGSGSALLDAPGKLGKILIGMNKALGEIPVTVKLRTGIKDGRNTAHKLMSRLSTEFSAACITLHGRTRQQRYTKLADWDYIKQCVEAVREAEKDQDLPPVPIFGGGDCFSAEDYWTHVESTGVDGIMIGRGALIKPWIFTEIKERREWDISGRERLELIRKYAEYGLNHFGSDTAGVNTTRRYLCEALSFQYRYVPIGLLERLPGRINERAPAFRGRSDLETLLASANSNDWVKISEMFLGPVPDGWTFTPKHKSNAPRNVQQTSVPIIPRFDPATNTTSLAPMQVSPDEHDNVQFLASMMGGDLDLEVARQVLRKHNGKVEKAADAILQGDRGEDIQWLATQNTGSTISPAQMPPAPSNRVIDLTDDDDMSRALQMSMETSQSEVRFGPTDRAPDPAWQMVPSNSNVGTDASQEDQHLKAAIRASLNDLPPEESDIFPIEDTIREGGRPVAVRSETPELAYAALVFHALFHVPQVRRELGSAPLPTIDPDTPKDSSARAITNIVEYFVNLDLAQLSAIVDKYLLSSLQAQPMNMTADNVTDISADFLRTQAALISTHLNAERGEDDPESRLFFFRHGSVEYYAGVTRRLRRAQGDGFVVVVDVGLENIPNDLIGALSANLSRYTDTGSSHEVIVDPSDVVAFQLNYHRQATGSRQNLDTFVYPKTIYLDQFLLTNVELANQKRQLERDMHAEIAKLVAEKETLTRFNNRDTLTDLRSTLHYYENVAEAGGDADRERVIQETTAKLKSIVAAIVEQLEAIDRRVEKLRVAMNTVFDCAELQNHRYDLRSVLVHSGLLGRKQMYSYVQDVDGTWWKTVDFTVTEVTEETVLTDPNGLHMSAGPYLLFYSRHLPPEQIRVPIPWLETYVESVEQSNKTLLDLLPPELAAKAKIPPSVSSPSVQQDM